MDDINLIKFANFIQSLSRVTDLYICYHDYLFLHKLPKEIREHFNKACLENKSKSNCLCFSYCGLGGTVHRTIQNEKKGYCYKCPYGLKKISVPVFSQEKVLGILFGGPFSSSVSDTKNKKITDCLELFAGVSLHISEMLHPVWSFYSYGRKKTIHDFINANIQNKISLADLASSLSLSISRTSHLVIELFEESFTEILINERLKLAMIWLQTSDLEICDIALRLCFCDQSHFTKVFIKKVKMTPKQFRKQNQYIA